MNQNCVQLHVSLILSRNTFVQSVYFRFCVILLTDRLDVCVPYHVVVRTATAVKLLVWYVCVCVFMLTSIELKRK